MPGLPALRMKNRRVSRHHPGVQIARSLDLRAALAKRSHFLFGPRQTGKSTLVRDQLADVRVIDLLESDTYLALQRAPQRPDFPESLTPDFPELTIHELGDAFDLDRALHHGLLPSIYLDDDPDPDLAAYVGTYLREEIAHEALTRNVPGFARFLEVAALCNTEQINYTKIANDAQVARTTVQEYFQILRDTLLGWDVPAWQKTKRRKPVATAKFWFFDWGVVRHLRGTGKVRAPSPEFGHAFEAWVGHELKTWCDYRGGGASLCYWRSRSGHEVDFVVGDESAVEVKSSANVTDRHLAGIAALKEEGLLKRHIVVCRETRRRVVDGIEILPWRAFMDELWSDRLVRG